MCDNCGATLNGEKATVVRFSKKRSLAIRVCENARECNNRRNRRYES